MAATSVQANIKRITTNEYDKMIEEYKQQEADLVEELKSHQEADEAFLISCSYLLELAKRAEELFTRSQPDQKNRLLRFVFANASVKGEKLDYKLKTPFEGIVHCNETKDWLPSSDVIITLLGDRNYWRSMERKMNAIDEILHPKSTPEILEAAMVLS